MEPRQICSISNSEVKDRLKRNLQKPISVKRDICVKSGQSVFTMCNIKHKYENQALTLPETQKIQGISIESGIYMIKKRRLKVLIANNLDRDVYIQRGTSLCNVEVYKHPIVADQTQASVAGNQEASIYSASYLAQQRRTEINRQMNETDFPDRRDQLLD